MTDSATPPAPPLEDTTPVPVDDSPPPAGPISNLVSSSAAFAVGAIGASFALTYGLGSLTKPGPGLWPFSVCAAICVLAAVQALVGRRGGDGEKFVRASWMSMAGLVSLAVYVALLPMIGFEIPTLLLALVWTRLLGHERWLTSLITSASIVVAFYLIFVVALSTAIPHLF